MIALAPGLDAQMTLFALMVVVIGGLGRIEGAFWGAILVGLVDGFGRLFLPQMAMFLIFALMALVLALKPEGLLGRRAA
jgi:branched-chain amino acid transport system permease protein